MGEVIKLEDFDVKSVETVEGVIKSIDIKKAEEVFGEEAISPERIIAVLSVITDASDEPVRANLPVPKGLVYDTTKDEWRITDKLAYVRSIRNPASKFSAFLRKYGVPHKGIRVQVRMNEQGFFEPVL
jgi:hypothetical protein